MYLASLEQEGFSPNHRARVKSTISSFARWLMEEKGLLLRNPTRGIDLPSQQMLAPRELSEDQRYILRSLVEQEEGRRGAAIFALGYWAGCRVSDVSWLQMAHTHVGPKVGWLHVGYKSGKWRDINLMNEARKRKVSNTTINRLRNRFTSGALAWNVVNNPLTRPTGCATRLLLGVNRLLNHCRSPHAPKGGGSCWPAERWDSLLDALLEKDGPN